MIVFSALLIFNCSLSLIKVCYQNVIKNNLMGDWNSDLTYIKTMFIKDNKKFCI